MKRRFIDADAEERCMWECTLRDGSKAQCGRRKTRGDLCTQHAKMEAQWSCEYCGGNDELPPDHTMDCARPGSAAPDSAAAPAVGFPERDLSKPAERQGLFDKFTVSRNDYSDHKGGKHYGCRYFVLDMNHDAHAPAALLAYADSCAEPYPQLAADLRKEFAAPNVPKATPMIYAEFYTNDGNVTGTTEAPVLGVTANDDGSFTVCIDYWPPVDGTHAAHQPPASDGDVPMPEPLKRVVIKAAAGFSRNVVDEPAKDYVTIDQCKSYGDARALAALATTAAQTDAIRMGLEAAAKLCEDERLSDNLPCDSDKAYNRAIRHCVDAIRSIDPATVLEQKGLRSGPV